MKGYRYLNKRFVIWRMAIRSAAQSIENNNVLSETPKTQIVDDKTSEEIVDADIDQQMRK